MPKRKKALYFIIMLIKRDVHGIEYDPAMQYRFHLYATWFWFFLMFVVAFIPRLRHDVAALAILEASLWANFATHLSGMSSALAAANKDISQPLREFEH